MSARLRPGQAPRARPRVALNAAVTLDGKIADATRHKFDLSSRGDRRCMAVLREAAGVVIVGAGTLRAEDPPPFVRGQRRAPRAAGQRFTWVILTRSLRVPIDSRILKSEAIRKIVVAPARAGTAAAARRLRSRAELWRLGKRQVDLVALLRRLHRLGFRRVVVEGGGEVNFSFLEAGLVDDIYVTLCPYLLGGSGAPTLVDGRGFAAQQASKLRLVGHQRRGAEIFLHYRCRSSG
ncbi:MAG: dihydrofolate reductase family protein [Acidobacteriota bacterium]